MDYKICTKCKLNLEISNFGKFKRKTRLGIYKTYIRIYCNSCSNEISKTSRLNNPDRLINYNQLDSTKQRKRDWENNNQESIKYKRKIFYQNNKERLINNMKCPKYKETTKRRKNNRRKTDIIFKLRDNISNSINKALRLGKTHKAGQSILNYLEYNIVDLKNHLEKLFDENMNWKNHGKYWHIDHIIPQSDLIYTSMSDENFKICWSLNNLRPLEANQNMIDGATRIRHKNKLENNNNIVLY